MLTMLGSPRRCCDGITRRETLKAGASVALGGFGLPSCWPPAKRASCARARPRASFCCICSAGPRRRTCSTSSPTRPTEVRGEFKPIATNVPASRSASTCRRWPAGCTRRPSSARSTTRRAATTRCPATPATNRRPGHHHDERHLSAQHGLGVRVPAAAQGGGDLPDYVYMPCYLGWGQNIRRAGPYGGFLGKRYDALHHRVQPHGDRGHAPNRRRVPQTVARHAAARRQRSLPAEITIDRLERRATRLLAANRRRSCGSSKPAGAVDSFDPLQQQAFDMLTALEAADGFRPRQRRPASSSTVTAARCSGNSTLIGRRLVEAGRAVRQRHLGPVLGPRARSTTTPGTRTRNNFAILRSNKLPASIRLLGAAGRSRQPAACWTKRWWW